MDFNTENQIRQVVLDTETTGMDQESGSPENGHKVIEIGAVELINRRLTGNHLHFYLNPGRRVDLEAFKVHGISDEFLKDKPNFKNILQQFIDFTRDSELIIHNAPFDLAFLNQEFKQAGIDYKIEEHSKILDTLQFARSLYPGKRNNLDALSQRYHISNHDRTFHGALLDSEILAEVYLAMTGGQTDLVFQEPQQKKVQEIVSSELVERSADSVNKFKIIYPSIDENNNHESFLELLSKKSSKIIKW